MSIAIQFDGHQIRSLRVEQGRLFARQTDTSYLVIPGDDSRLKIVEKQAAHLARCERGLLLFGPTATEISELLRLPLQSAFETNGTLRSCDPVSRQFIAALVEGLLPPTEKLQHSTEKLQHCAVIAGTVNDQEQLTTEFLNQLVRLRGYEATEISPGAALILAAGEKQGYSGIAMHGGSTQIDVSVLHRATEFVQFQQQFGHSLLDDQLARDESSYLRMQDGREVLHTRPLRIWRESIDNINTIESPRKLELRHKYRQTLMDIFLELKRHLSASVVRHIPAHLPLILGGEFARLAGMRGLFQEVLNNIELPVQIDVIEPVSNPDFACLKGGLVAIETAFAATGRIAA